MPTGISQVMSVHMSEQFIKRHVIFDFDPECDLMLLYYCTGPITGVDTWLIINYWANEPIRLILC